MFPILQLGPLAIQVPGLVLLLGLWLGISLAEKYSSRYGITSNTLYNLVFLALVAGLVGARLSYIIRFPSVFAESPISAISLNPNLLDPIGGFTAALLAVLIYGQRKNLQFWSTLDALTPVMGVFTVAIGVSHIASGAAFGAVSDLPWAVKIWGEFRHPTQVYETLSAIIILVILWPSRKLWETMAEGTYFLSFISLSACARIIIEAFRGDSILLPGGFRTAQVAAFGILALCLWGIWKRQLSQTSEQDPTPLD